MINAPGHAIVDQQARLVAARLWSLRNQRGRKVVVELVEPHPAATLQSPIVRETTIERATERVEERVNAAAFEAVLERTREDLSRLAETAAEAAASLPARIGDAVEDGLREQVLPVGRHVAEIRGLLNRLIRRLDDLEGDAVADRHARVDDLALLVDLIGSGWENVDERLARIEAAVGVHAGNGNGTAVQAAARAA